MKIRIIATGVEGQHDKLFPSTCFGPEGPPAFWLLENGCEEVVIPPYTPTPEEIESQRVADILSQLSEIDRKTIRPLSEGETDRVAELRSQAAALRAQL